MTAVLKTVLILACLLTCFYTLHKIRKSQMQIEDSVFWIIISALLVIVSIFPGIGVPVNFVFLAMIFILLYKVFSMSVRISQLEYKLKNLVQQIAIKNYESQERKRKNEK